jgi:hypothetical protein
MFKQMVLVAVAVGALTWVAGAAADSSTRAGDYTVYHNAVTADSLNPAVAQANGILRSKTRGVLNVSVIKAQAGTSGTPVKAQVEVAIVDAAGQKTPVPMREIEAQGAVSYLGQFPIANGQEILFDLRVQPVGVAPPIELRMSQEFFTE